MESTEVTLGGKPVQILSWADKQAKQQEWFKKNVNYYINLSNFNYTNGPTHKQDLKMLYEVYNNKFPLKWFAHITDPLSAKIPAHKVFPAKVRPVTILRTNLDLLMAEYTRRPFIYQVNNLGDEGYSNYMEQLNAKVQQNVQKYFQLALQQQLAQQDMTDQNGQPVSEEAAKAIQDAMDNIQYPEQIQEEFHGSYRDKVAIQAQRWLKRAIREHDIRPKFLRMFKDWLIAGQSYSYKAVDFDNITYERVSPLMIEYDKSPEVTYVEDAEWVCVKRFLTASDVVDRFYDELKEEDNIKIMSTAIYSTPDNFLSFLTENYSTAETYSKVPVWHVQWKGRKKIGFLSYINPETGQLEESTVDEDYTVNTAMGEKVEWMWVNEVYEGWRIGLDMFVKLRALPIQRNAMNNFSTCKLSYNGRKYSDTHAENISVMEIGLPFQIMYIIVTRTLELTIAKSKGKILLIDQNAIPNEGDWDEEKFFYYSEALGYGLLNRNQIGVDKSWNQYQVLDMTLFDSISQLIELQSYFKQQWDDIIGINRQRKGQTYASDLQGVNERAVFQSTVITDMIFNLFEEFTEKELQGLIDLSKFTNVSGVRKIWYDTEVGNEVINIDANEYCNAELGIFLESSSEAIAIKNKVEANVQAMIQNQVKPSTILEVLQTQNLSELKQKLKRIEQIQDQVAQQNQESEQEAAKQLDERKKQFMEYEKLLDTQFMNAEYDRKEDIEMIKGEFNTFTFQDGDSNDNGIPDAQEVAKTQLERDKLAQKREQVTNDRADRLAKHQVDISLKEKQLALQAQAQTDKAKLERQKIQLNRKQ
jgi:hypothetical protein